MSFACALDIVAKQGRGGRGIICFRRQMSNMVRTPTNTWALTRMSGGRLSKRIMLGNLEGVARRGKVRRRNSGPIAYRATSGRLAQGGTGKQQHWRQRCGLRRSRRVDGGLWPRGKKRCRHGYSLPGEESGRKTGKLVLRKI